jgi:exopolysaccharide biosynthesis polyprenyl glycosylphosphotransferase
MVQRFSRTSFHGRMAFATGLALAAATTIVAVLSPTPSSSGGVPVEPLVWSLAFSGAVLLLTGMRNGYAPPLRPELLDAVRDIVEVTAMAAMFTLVGRALFSDEPFYAAETIRHWLVLVPCLVACRTTVLWYETRSRRGGRVARPTLIVGAGKVGQRVAQRLLGDPDLGLAPIAFLDADPLDAQTPVSAHLPVHSVDESLEDIVRRYGIKQAILAFRLSGDQDLPELVRELWNLGVGVTVVPRLFELGGERLIRAWLGGVPLAEIRPEPAHSHRLVLKYASDRVFAGLALILLAPLLAVIALAVRISLGRQVIFSQVRLGRDGLHFQMLKFRTLHAAPEGAPEADAGWANGELGVEASPVSSSAEERATRVGAFLRRSSLDELPQLFNVLRGEMSLIGPRPERVSYAEQFEDSVYRYSDRHRLRSGLTGWAQVSGLRGRTSLADRVEWDNFYIEHWTPWLDFKIAVKTISCMLEGSPN